MIFHAFKKRNALQVVAALLLAGLNPVLAATLGSSPVTESRDLKTNRLSFYFQNIETRMLLQLIAKNSGVNFIISDAVKGSITLNLKNVSWQRALDIIMKTQNLASRRIGNALYISTIEDMTSTEAKQLQLADTIANSGRLESVKIHLNYMNAMDLATLLKGPQSVLLTPRGQVAVDSRTNSLIIRDTKQNIQDILPEIRWLDVPARQVLIEARIVNIDTTYERELGVRFGVSNTSTLSGTLSGANQLSQGIAPSLVTPFTDRLNFNIPANALFDGAVPGSIALALAKLGPVLLDMELSALEGEQHLQVIARPRVITANQQKAVIQTGEEIPYQEASSSGATSITFKKAVLSLTIVPQITPNNKIILNLKVTQDSRGQNVAVGATSTAGSTGATTPVNIPAINTEEVESNVLLNNNETIVIGGVYKTVKQNSMDRIPFFGTLPVVGHLFTHEGVHNEKHELLIFLTPKIITPQPAVKTVVTRVMECDPAIAPCVKKKPAAGCRVYPGMHSVNRDEK